MNSNQKSANTNTTRSKRNNPKTHQRDGGSTSGTPLSAARSGSLISTDTVELLGRKLIKSLDQLISERLADLEEAISLKIERAISSVNSEVQKLREEVNVLHTELSQVKQELDDVRRANRSTDVVISGIPQGQDEKLLDILNKVSTIINHTLSPYSVAFRSTNSGQHGSAKHSNSPLIVKFPTSCERRIFIEKFKRHGTICLNQISPNFVSDSRVFINESLTRRNQLILRKALFYRRNKKIHSVFSRNGLVHIRVRPDDAAITINNIEILNDTINEANALDA